MGSVPGRAQVHRCRYNDTPPTLTPSTPPPDRPTEDAPPGETGCHDNLTYFWLAAAGRATAPSTRATRGGF